MSQSLPQIDSQILTINKVICRKIDELEGSERGYVSQDILAQLRNFVEHIMLKIWKHPVDVENSYENICDAIQFVKSRGDLKFLRRFHDYLQTVASHYTLDEENSERLMLKYYEYLLKIKALLKDHYSLDVLQNIEKFPVDTDPGLKEYYEKIAEKLEQPGILTSSEPRSDRFYIHKIKPFFAKRRIYYEVTFISTNVNASKFDRVIAFTSKDISGFYAARLSLIEQSIEVMDRTMPILIVSDWQVSIRPCEIDNFSRIFGIQTRATSRSVEYRNLMRYLTSSGFNLVEVIDFPDRAYEDFKLKVTKNTTPSDFLSVLDSCRELTVSKSPGCNIIRYLLLRLNNRIIKSQLDRRTSSEHLSKLYLKNGCIPFDKMPFNTSPIDHNPKISDIYDCIQSEDRAHELLARRIQNNAEIRGHIYTQEEELASFDNKDALVTTYNSKVWFGHSGRKIKKFHNFLYISEYEENTLIAIRQIKHLASLGVKNYSNSVDSWLKSYHSADCDEKRSALRDMFSCSLVALIYGPAGTGKSTIINHISHYFSEFKKIYLAQTNPAIDNLKRKVDASNTSFYTIAKFLNSPSLSGECAILIIDECSTVSNKDIKEVLDKAKFQLLILVGDIYQIESIRFGNWFSAARNFIPKTSVFELTKPYRSQNDRLLELWKRVRNIEDTIIEHIARNDYSCNLDATIFDHTGDEQIILCLNYDGLYGINNINRFLQDSNPSQAIEWGVHKYKVGDPILFNESKRFSPLIYNNMKGKISGIQILEEQDKIQFDVEIDMTISGIHESIYDFELLDSSENGNSIIRFTVNHYQTTDEDDDDSASNVVPFQVAYAVSIHKAQGLEYESVKIVITDETDELITHNIFYTAITRARNKLKIYWSPEVEKKVIEQFKSKRPNKDVALLKLRDPSLAAS